MKDLTVSPTITIKQAMKKLDQTAEKCLLVVDEELKLLGTLTDGDIRRAILGGNNFSDGINIDSNKSLKIAVTFDDGYKDTLHTIAPILHEYRIPFTVFVISDFVKHRVKDYLNEKELFELSQLPKVTIGSHGSTHTPLTELSEANLIEELVSSKKYLEDVTSHNINIISYPHGGINKKVRSEAINAGYKVGGTSHFNINNYSKDPMLLSRTLINAGDYERVFKQKLKGSWDWNRFRNIGSLIK